MSAQDAAPVIVTGAQGGIGLGIAEHFARAGYPVLVSDIVDGTPGDALAARWQVTTPVVTTHCDIANPESVEAMLDGIQSAFGAQAFTLINNAGTQVWGDFIDADLDDIKRVLDVNLFGTMLVTQRFARRRVAAGGGGCIVNIGSGCNKIAFPGLASYVASKGGIETFTKSAAFELGKHGIRVNCIAPGATETERTRVETDGYAERWSPLTPLGRIGTVEDIARAVLALSGEGFEFVSGQTLGVDGGLFARAIWPSDY